MVDRGRGWNLFAQELEEILQAHHQRLSALDPRLGIAEDRARRLQQSLHLSANLPVLSPEELDTLEIALPLSSEESIRLRAALLATAVEQMLADRIGRERAVQAVKSIVPLLRAGIQEQYLTENMFQERRGPDGEALENTEIDRIWEEIWEMLDAAELALQLSEGLPSNRERERLKKLREARSDFQDALDLLNRLGRGIKALPIWTQAYQEGRRGLEQTTERLEELGEAR